MPALSPRRVRLFALTALWSVAVLGAVEVARRLPRDPQRETRLRAARLMADGGAVLRAERLRLGLGIDEKLDPNQTGLIGPEYTDLTTSLGRLAAKRTSTNPAFAAVVVTLLQRAGVKAGDTVAVNFSGSFPALNLAVLAAVEAMDLRATIVSSIGASSHGANEPDWTWLDMERTLREHGIISRATTAASLGGIIDEAGGLGGTGLALGREAIRRHGVAFLDDGGHATLARDIARRLAVFDRDSEAKPAAFVNVGGTLVALGAATSARPFPPGLTLTAPSVSTNPRRGLLVRMAERGVPVIHLLNVRALAARYDLPFDPKTMPAWSDAAILKPTRHARALAAGGGLLIGLALWRIRRRQDSPAPAASPPAAAPLQSLRPP